MLPDPLAEQRGENVHEACKLFWHGKHQGPPITWFKVLITYRTCRLPSKMDKVELRTRLLTAEHRKVSPHDPVRHLSERRLGPAGRRHALWGPDRRRQSCGHARKLSAHPSRPGPSGDPGRATRL